MANTALLQSLNAPVLSKEFMNEYISSMTYGDYSFNREFALPRAIDDNTRYLREDLYEQMLYDAQVRANVNLLIYGIIGGGIEVEPASNSTKDRDIAAFIKRCLVEVIEETPLLSEVLPDMLLAMALGNRICEIVWNQPGDTPGPDRGQWTIRRAKVKDRKKVTFWVDKKGNVVGIASRNSWFNSGQDDLPPGIYRPESDTGVVVFPLTDELFKDHFGWISWKPKDGDPRGQSDLQSAYNPWWYKQQAAPEYMKYLANFAIGSLWMELSENADRSERTSIGLDGQPTGTGAMSATDRGVAMLQQFQNLSVMAVENGTKINTIQSQSDGRAFTMALDHFNNEINLSITGQATANTKDGSSGRSPVVGQEILNGPIAYGCSKAEAFLQRFFVNPIMKKNYSRLARPPKVRLPGQNKDDFLTAASGVSKLLLTNALPPSMWPQIYMKAGLEIPDSESLQKLDALYWKQKENEATAPTLSSRLSSTGQNIQDRTGGN